LQAPGRDLRRGNEGLRPRCSYSGLGCLKIEYAKSGFGGVVRRYRGEMAGYGFAPDARQSIKIGESFVSGIEK
jgi:hypothetical protein